MSNFAIAIDGPSGSGKSTVAKRIAKELDIIYVDTGAMYRAVGLYCINNGIDTKNDTAVSEIVDEIKLTIKPEKGIQKIYLDGIDVTDTIRTQEVGQAASDVGVILKVRERLVEIQREIAKGNSVIMDGRDIGTNVLTDAQYKIYLDASTDERTNRRCNELREKGLPCEKETVKQQIIERDFNDMNRKHNPLKIAETAIVIDSSNMTIEDVTAKIISIVKAGK